MMTTKRPLSEGCSHYASSRSRPIRMFAARAPVALTAKALNATDRRDRRVRVVAKANVDALAPPVTHREMFSIAAKPTKEVKPTTDWKSVVSSPSAAFTAGFVASALIVKAHIAAKSGSKLRKSKPMLRYFDAKGAAEVIRTLFAATGVEFEDYRYTFSMDGPKPTICDQHGVDKDAGMFNSNLKRLPVLEFQGQRIGQSRAIERFVAKDLGLMGKGALQEAEIDAYCEHVRDLREAYQKVRGNPFAPTTPEIEAAKEKWYNETMKQWMEKIECITGEGGYAIGRKMSLADIVLYCALTQSFSDGEKAMAACANAPKVRAVVDEVGRNKGVQEWLRTRPDNRF